MKMELSMLEKSKSKHRSYQPTWLVRLFSKSFTLRTNLDFNECLRLIQALEHRKLRYHGTYLKVELNAEVSPFRFKIIQILPSSRYGDDWETILVGDIVDETNLIMTIIRVNAYPHLRQELFWGTVGFTLSFLIIWAYSRQFESLAWNYISAIQYLLIGIFVILLIIFPPYTIWESFKRRDELIQIFCEQFPAKRNQPGIT
jgi:hypothetical protein